MKSFKKSISIFLAIHLSIISLVFSSPISPMTKASTAKNETASMKTAMNPSPATPHSDRKEPVCMNYKALSSKNRQLISDTRYALESISLELKETEFNTKLNLVLSKYSPSFKTEPLPSHLHGLIAELYLRKLIFKTIGIQNLSYKKFTVFADLILYHRAMDHLGFVNDLEFTLAKRNLEVEIVKYFQERQQPILNLFKEESPLIFSSLSKKTKPNMNSDLVEKANQYIQTETTKAQMLGSIEIIWAQLLNRNQENRMETMANNALIDFTVNTATASAGLAAMVRVALTSAMTTAAATSASHLINTTNALWAISLQAAIGCGVGLTAKFTLESVNTSYLNMSRALYSSLLNKTSFACELGEAMKTKETSSTKKVVIPHAPESATKIDYLLACASGATLRLFPTTLGVAIDGVVLASLAMISYSLAEEAYTILKEVPHLSQLKSKAQKNTNNPEESAALQRKIEESEAKIALYLLAMGENSILAVRNGFFLYLHRNNIAQATSNAKNFLHLQSNKLAQSQTPGAKTLKMIMDSKF